MAKKKKPRRIKLGIPSPTNPSDGGLYMGRAGTVEKRLGNAFLAIIHSLCQKREKGCCIYEHEKQLFPVGFILREAGLFDPDVPDKLRELWDAIDQAIDNAYDSGKRDGASLLQQLASGAASIEDYNEATLGRPTD
jgi:hypothetical protein